MLFQQQQKRWVNVLFCAISLPFLSSAQNILAPLGGEYLVSGQLPGNQVYPGLAFSRFGGYVIWQDDAADGDGAAICAQRLNANLSGTLSPIHINAIVSSNQEKPKIAMLSDGSAAAVWQGGEPGKQNIFLRILNSNGTFLGPENQINQYNAQFQIEPSVGVLTDDTIVVVWDSYDQDGNLRAVVARLFSADGAALGDEFIVNQTTVLNQRSAEIAALPGGGFLIAWVSERSLGGDIFGGAQFTSDVMVRKYSSTGTALGGELKVNLNSHICASPSVMAMANDAFAVAWSQRDLSNPANGWDVYAAGYDSLGNRLGSEYLVNTNRFGDQHSPQLAHHDGTLFAVWTSLGQDGSHEGVYGRIMNPTGQPFDTELRINTGTFNRQVHPAVAADVSGRFLIVWANYSDGGTFFDLHAQRLASAQPLPILPAPFCNALNQASIAISWAPLAGFEVQQYEIYVDGAASPIVTTNQYHVLTGLVPGTSYSIELNYVLSDGRRGNRSAATTTTTWGLDANFDGLPDDWQERHWSSDAANWQSPLLDSDNDGANNLSEFLAGTNPID
ncbi:MAG: fibronectin type III domain-containing protein, partial [Limisphaerales bacterium]